jgi:hypothetical protein
MKRVIKNLFLFSFLIFLGGCIEITEEITVSKDGSGTIKMSIDMGMVGSSLNNDNTKFDVSYLQKIKELPNQAKAALKDFKGIHNVEIVSDDKKGLYSVGFEFDNSSILNKAIYKVFGKNKSAFTPSFVKISKHKLKKTDLSPFIKKAFKNVKQSGYNEMFYAFISLNSIYHFPADVINASNIKSQQPDPRTVITKFTLDEILKGGFDFGNVIRYK